MPRERDGYTQPTTGGCLVWIDASPGASKTEVTGVNQWRKALQIRIAAQPKEGEANEELVRFISEALSISRKDIEIVSGHRSSSKVVMVPITEEKVLRVFGE